MPRSPRARDVALAQMGGGVSAHAAGGAALDLGARVGGNAATRGVVDPPYRRHRRRLYDKEILRSGRWLTGGVWWNVDESLLRRVVINFQKARLRGVRIPVVWNHSNDARDKIGEVIRVYLSSGSLRARFWAVHEHDVRRLNHGEFEVSVEVAEPWIDGCGNRYDVFLSHVAIVTHPVMTPQAPLRRLRMSQVRQSQGEMNMTDGIAALPDVLQPVGENAASAAPIALSVEGSSPEAIAGLVNDIVDALGTSFRLPATTTSDNLLENLRRLRDEVDVLVREDDEPTTIEGDEEADHLRRQLGRVTRQLAVERRRSLSERARLFEDAVDHLVGEGRLLANEKPVLLEAARPSGYSLSLLAPFQRLASGAAIPMTPYARRVATSAAPPIAPTSAMSSSRASEIARDYT